MGKRKKSYHKKGRASTKYHAVFIKLYQRFVKARNLGRKLHMHGFTLMLTKLMLTQIWMQHMFRKVLLCVSLSNTISNWE